MAVEMSVNEHIFVLLQKALNNKDEETFLMLFNEKTSINNYYLLKRAAFNGCLRCVKILIPLVPNYKDMENYTAWTNHEHIKVYLESLDNK